MGDDVFWISFCFWDFGFVHRREGTWLADTPILCCCFFPRPFLPCLHLFHPVCAFCSFRSPVLAASSANTPVPSRAPLSSPFRHLNDLYPAPRIPFFERNGFRAHSKPKIKLTTYQKALSHIHSCSVLYTIPRLCHPLFHVVCHFSLMGSDNIVIDMCITYRLRFVFVALYIDGSFLHFSLVDILILQISLQPTPLPMIMYTDDIVTNQVSIQFYPRIPTSIEAVSQLRTDQYSDLSSIHTPKC